MNATVVSEMLEGAAARWADWMFQMTWQVAVLVIVLSVATYVLRRRSAVFLHALWILVLVRLVVPPAFAFPTGWGWWLDHPPLALVSGNHPVTAGSTSALAPLSPSAMPARSSEVESTASAGTVASSIDGAAPDRNTEPRSAAAAGTISQPAAPVDAAATARAGRPWAVYLLLAWAGVSGTLLVMLGLGSLRVGRWVRDATPLTDPALCDMLHDCCERLEVGGGIELRNSESCTTPVVVGHFQPVILLPATVLEGLEPAELRSVLIHELQHIRRGDAIFNFFQGVLGAVYFFHPLVWWANRRIRELREDACDEMTVAALEGLRKPYGSALLKVTEMFGYASPPLALGVMETKHPARRRLQRILDPNLPTRVQLGWGSYVMLLVFAALLLPAGPGRTGAEAVAKLGTPEASSLRVTTADKSGLQLPADAAAAKPTSIQGFESVPGNGPTDVRSDAPLEAAARVIAADLKPNSVTPPPSLNLRYRWEQGRRYSYSMRIEADSRDQVETFAGTISYQVRSTTDAGADLAFDGRLAPSRRIKNPARGFAVGPPRYTSYSPYTAIGSSQGVPTEHVLRVDAQGKVQNSFGDLQLPYMLGSLSRIMLVPLDGAAEKWQTADRTTVKIYAESSFPRARFGPFAEDDEVSSLDAKEQSTFVREKFEKEQATIRKEYELKSTESHNGEPKVELTGSGTIVFDNRLGLPVSLEFIATLTRVDTNFYQRTPLRISAQLLSEAQIEKRPEEPRPGQEKQPLDAAALERLIGDLKSGDDRRTREATTKLEAALPGDRRAEVARLLEEQLDHKDNYSRQRAMRALVVWCGDESVPRLLRALDDEFFTVRWGAMEALTRLKDPRAAHPIAERYQRDRIKAAASLRGLGHIAEDAASSLLADKEWSIRNDACAILKDIGTATSVPALEEAARRDENALVRSSAQSALAAIRERE